MLDWFSASFPETSHSLSEIYNCHYYDQCTLVQVAIDYPWISATVLAFLSAFMLISALVVIAGLLIVFVIACMIFSAACIGFGNVVSGGFARFIKWGRPYDPRNM